MGDVAMSWFLILLALGVGTLSLMASASAHYEQFAGRKSRALHIAAAVLMGAAVALAGMA